MDSLQTGRTYWEKRCLEAEHLVSTLHNNADREVGRLVREMRVGTRLVCGIGRGSQNVYMTAEMRADRPPNLDPWVWLPGLWADPAEALRSIADGVERDDHCVLPTNDQEMAEWMAAKRKKERAT